MKNTITTSISALVFLVIGLFIGKSNNPIEIQTVVKTNIIEKPVVEYVDKYVTNVVEKVVEAEIPSSYLKAMELQKSIFAAEFAKHDKIPFNIDSVHVSVYISENLKDIISKETLQNLIELEIRKIGIKVDEKSPYVLNFEFYSFETKDKTQHVYRYSLNLQSPAYMIKGLKATHVILPILWENSNFGIVGSKNASKTIKDELEETTKIFSNLIFSTCIQ